LQHCRWNRQTRFYCPCDREPVRSFEAPQAAFSKLSGDRPVFAMLKAAKHQLFG
jgi:hypothetical protein